MSILREQEDRDMSATELIEEVQHDSITEATSGCRVGPLFAPLAFSLVTSGIYRAAYPNERTYSFLEPYRFRTFISLSPGEIKPELRQYCHQHDIALLEYDVKFNQEPFLTMDVTTVQQAIHTALSRSSTQGPVLIFCVNGKVRTGCVVACLRKHLQWSMASIVEEFEAFTDPEGTLCDLMFIDRYEPLPQNDPVTL